MKNPKIEKKEEFLVAGLKYHGQNAKGEISALWQEFNTLYPKVEKFAGGPCFGICCDVIMNQDNNDYGAFDYYAGSMIKPDSDTPEGMVTKSVPAGTWLIFVHKGKLDTLKNTYSYIYKQFMPDSEYEPSGIDVEMYDGRFIPDSDESLFEIWIGIKETK